MKYEVSTHSQGSLNVLITIFRFYGYDLEQILQSKVDCSDFGPVRGQAMDGMAHYWMGHSLFLTISVGVHNLANRGFYSFTGGKKTLKLSSR